jgi:hypothetical protein
MGVGLCMCGIVGIMNTANRIFFDDPSVVKSFLPTAVHMTPVCSL